MNEQDRKTMAPKKKNPEADPLPARGAIDLVNVSDTLEDTGSRFER